MYIYYFTDCKVSDEGMKYAGTMSSTVTDRTCQDWDSQTPHSHSFTDPNQFPDASMSDASNFCRNPDGRAGGPWCYTTDQGTEWEYCDIPLCEGVKLLPLASTRVPQAM